MSRLVTNFGEYLNAPINGAEISATQKLYAGIAIGSLRGIVSGAIAGNSPDDAQRIYFPNNTEHVNIIKELDNAISCDSSLLSANGVAVVRDVKQLGQSELTAVIFKAYVLPQEMPVSSSVAV